MMKTNRLAVLILLAAVILPVTPLPLPSVYADGLVSKAARELAEQLAAKFGKGVVHEGTEALAGRIARAAAKHGDDVVAAVRKVGPKALNLADDAGENAPRMLRFLTRHGDDGLQVLSKPQGLELFTRFGDDAAEVLIRHKGVAAEVIEQMGRPAVEALGAIGPQAGRRMAMMAGDLAASPQGADVMNVIAKYGDPAMEFLWKHKVVLAGGATLVAFLADPKPYIDGTAELATVVGENVARPAVVAVGNVAQEAAEFVRWTLTCTLLGLAAAAGLAFKCGVFEKPVVRAAFHAAGRYLGERLPPGLLKKKE